MLLESTKSQLTGEPTYGYGRKLNRNKNKNRTGKYNTLFVSKEVIRNNTRTDLSKFPLKYIYL